MLSDMESVRPLGDEARRRHTEAIAQYMQSRNPCLNALLELIKDDNAGNRQNAPRWTSLCASMDRVPEDCFIAEIRILSAMVGVSPATLGEQAGRIIQTEKQFFSTLANVNVAAVRDYLVANAQDLQTYTDGLSRAWEEIKQQSEEAHQDERDSYKEILELVNEGALRLAEDKNSLREKAAEIASRVFEATGRVASIIEYILNLPEGTGDLIEKIMEFLKDRTEAWSKWNQYLAERYDKYRSLVDREKGGALPIFKECRQQVYDYWNEKGTKASRVWPNTARSSIDNWRSSCPTTGQRDDADRFSADVYKAIDEQWKKVEAVGKTFEEKWNGVFQGPLTPTTQDKLTDSIAWKQNANSLIAVGVVELAQAFLKDSDDVYGASLTEPIRQLQEAAEKLPDEVEHKGEAVQAVIALRDKIRSEVADRLKSLQEQIDKAAKQLDRNTVEKLFDRSDIENLVV